LSNKNEKGFTLVEIMAVAVIIGILAAVAAPRFINSKKYEIKNAVRNLVRDIKYAQQEAMRMKYDHNTGNVGVRISFSPKSKTGDPATGVTTANPAHYKIFYIDNSGGENPLENERYTEEIELPAGIDFLENTPPGTVNLVSSDKEVQLTFNHNGEISSQNWGSEVSGFVYLQDEYKMVSIEIKKPWGHITVREYPK